MLCGHGTPHTRFLTYKLKSIFQCSEIYQNAPNGNSCLPPGIPNSAVNALDILTSLASNTTNAFIGRLASEPGNPGWGDDGDETPPEGSQGTTEE